MMNEEDMLGSIVWYIEPLSLSEEKRWGFICNKVAEYDKYQNIIIITTFQTTQNTAFLYDWKGEQWDLADNNE